MFASSHMFVCVAFALLAVVVLHADLTELPTSENVVEDISKLLRKSGVCGLCGDFLRNLDSFHLSHSTALLRATQRYEKSQSAFLRACEQDSSAAGCDTALDRSRLEKAKRCAVTISRVEDLYAVEDVRVYSFVHSRYDDLLEYLLGEKDQEECMSCVVEDGRSPGLVTNPATEVIISHVWYLLYPVNERHQAFCWQYCEGVLTFSERLKLWMLRFYLTRAVRFRLIALQHESGTVYCLLFQLLLLLTVLQRYVFDSKRNGHAVGGGGGGGGTLVMASNWHADANVVAVAKSGSRRSVMARGKGAGGKR